MAHPYWLIVPTSLVLGLAAGWVMHRADFCMTAMFRDVFLFRDGFMPRMLVLLVVLSMVMFELLRLSGLAAPYPFPLLGPASLSNVLGGVLFGVGMVLAGGCVIGTLYKMGAGSLLSALAFVGLITGATLYAVIHELWLGFARATTLLPGPTTLAEWLGVDPLWVLGPAVVLGAWLLWRWARAGRLRQRGYADGFLQPWKAAVILAVIGTISYLLVGMPLGVTTSYSKLGAELAQTVVPGWVAAQSYFQAVPLDYTPPFASQSVQGGPGPGLDAIAAIQFPLVFGIVAGAAISAALLRELRLHWRMPARQYASALIGGLLLGLAARMVPACNVWHLWGGLPVLALQSLLFVVGVVGGAWLGSGLLRRVVMPA